MFSTYIFAHDNVSKTFLPLYITIMQSSMIHRREGLCLVYPMAYERLSWQDPACSQSPHASLKILSRTSLLQLQKRPKKQQWLHAGQAARGWWWQTVVHWALTHHADRAAAGAPGQAGSRGSHRGPDSPERGTLRAERPDSAAPAPRGLTGHRAERCKGGSE